MSRPADPNAKEALAGAAREEFAKKGLKGARIEDITAACGLSKGAFYLHYPSKEALFGELVRSFLCELSCTAEERRGDMERFFKEHGPISRRDVQERSSRYRRMVEMEAAQDLRTLEHLWAYRDVMGVLLRGSQGTRFEGTIWDVTDREIDRVKASFTRFQRNRACRKDIPAEIFGSLIVGTYVLLAMRMAGMREKPDLAEWARSLQTLIREGSSPLEQHPAPPRRHPGRRAS